MSRSEILYQGHEVKLLTSGEPYFHELFRLIREATVFIHLQVYIFEEDETGIDVAHALIEAAGRGVKVYIVGDGYGTRLSKEFLSPMKKAGIYFRQFAPMNGLRVGRRLHHKILINDKMEALLGGINIGNRYHGSESEEAWLDFAVQLCGPASVPVLRVCESTWPRNFRRRHFTSQRHITAAACGHMEVAVAQNDWYRKKLQISKAYLKSVEQAQNEIWFVASYFFPGRKMRKAMMRASRRGVKIRLLLSGISDVPLVREGTRFLYDWLFRHKLEIYEWQKSVMHGKMMIRDTDWVSVGSYNINKLSDYGSLELNVNIHDRQFATDALSMLQRLLAEGALQEMPEKYKAGKTWPGQFFNWFSYNFVRLWLRVYFWLSDDRKR